MLIVIYVFKIKHQKFNKYKNVLVYYLLLKYHKKTNNVQTFLWTILHIIGGRWATNW